MSAIPPAPVRATIDDVMREPGKAELIRGKIVRFPMTAETHSDVVGRIFRKLADFADLTKIGKAFGDATGFAVPELASGRESFGPDVSFFIGPERKNKRKFIPDAPTFAVEVRSENDYGPAQNREYAAKRVDYFEAGTKVVWDVDPDAKTVACYRASDPLTPQIFRPGEDADAEPAVPGWSIAVDWVFADV